MKEMRGIEEVLKSIVRLLEERKVDYVIVGGIAVSAWVISAQPGMLI